MAGEISTCSESIEWIRFGYDCSESCFYAYELRCGLVLLVVRTTPWSAGRSERAGGVLLRWRCVGRENGAGGQPISVCALGWWLLMGSVRPVRGTMVAVLA